MQTNLSPMYRCEDGNIVQFYEMAVPHEQRTLAEGRPVNFRALMARIQSPGMKNQIHHQEIHLLNDNGDIVRRKLSNTTRDKRRVYYDEMYAAQLRAYKEGREGTEALGTPLETYPKIDVGTAATLRANGVYTLEALKAVPDAQLESLGPQARLLRENVTKFLDSMTGNTALMQKNEELAKRLAELEAKFSANAAPVQTASAEAGVPEKKRRGRKPKSLIEAPPPVEAAAA